MYVQLHDIKVDQSANADIVIYCIYYILILLYCWYSIYVFFFSLACKAEAKD